MEVSMKVIAAISMSACMTAAALAQDGAHGPVLVDPDFGLTLETPDGFDAKLVGQTPEGIVVITVSSDNPGLPAVDPSGDLCDISFQYDPAYGQGDQDWVNSLVLDTGTYERMAQEVAVPGTIEGGKDFTLHGSYAHRVHGKHETGGAFTVAVIPSPSGYVTLSCISAEEKTDWNLIDPLIEAITIPGQPRDHLVPSGRCESEIAAISSQIGHAEGAPFDRHMIAVLDGERKRIAEQCGGIDADVVMDAAMIEAGHETSYRSLRYDALSAIGSDLLTREQHEALDGGRRQVVATSDEATGERYLRYMHFIVGLRSLDQ
ncbi:hypothetical protein ASG47_12290 [Devosia sp. Leaf420]|nr:hypothetical protein ASG47_12290 [Devosia sp. Leaf420]